MSSTNLLWFGNPFLRFCKCVGYDFVREAKGYFSFSTYKWINGLNPIESVHVDDS